MSGIIAVYAHGKSFELTSSPKGLPPSQRDALVKFALGRL